MGFFFLNSNGMDINVQPDPSLTFIAIGGIIDFYIYMGPTPADIVRQHTDVVGRSFLPAYFTLGFHLCRWKYNTNENLKKVKKLLTRPKKSDTILISYLTNRLLSVIERLKSHTMFNGSTLTQCPSALIGLMTSKG